MQMIFFKPKGIFFLYSRRQEVDDQSLQGPRGGAGVLGPEPQCLWLLPATARHQASSLHPELQARELGRKGVSSHSVRDTAESSPGVTGSASGLSPLLHSRCPGSPRKFRIRACLGSGCTSGPRLSTPPSGGRGASTPFWNLAGISMLAHVPSLSSLSVVGCSTQNRHKGQTH